MLERNDTKGRKTNQKLTAITEALKKVTWERESIYWRHFKLPYRDQGQIKCQGRREKIVKDDFRVLRPGKGKGTNRKLVNWED